MKLGIYETTHHETLPALLDLGEECFEEINVFLRKDSYENVTNGKQPETIWPKTVFYIQASESNRSFINKFCRFAKTNDCTHIHISTLDNNLLHFAVKLLSIRKPVSLSVQAINEYCIYRVNSIRDITESMAKLFFHKRIRSYRVFFPLMVNILQKKLPQSKPVYIPSRFFSGDRTCHLKNDSSFTIVVPGSIDPNRRDYHYIVSFCREFFSIYNGTINIRLVILGNCRNEYGTTILKELKRIAEGKFDLVYYESYIPQKEYERQLSGASVIWSPININTSGIRKTPEIYGASTATGLTADLLLNCIPALVPEGFTVPEHYEHALITYKSQEELKNLLLEFIKKKGPDEETRKKIYDSFNSLRKENFRETFKKLIISQ